VLIDAAIHYGMPLSIPPWLMHSPLQIRSSRFPAWIDRVESLLKWQGVKTGVEGKSSCCADRHGADRRKDSGSDSRAA